MQHRLAALLITCALAGCASAPPSFATTLTTAAPGTGILIVHRESTFAGSGCGARVLVDGRPVADLQRDEKVTLYLPPGEHVIAARMAGRLCSGNGNEAVVQVEAGKRRTWELVVRFGWESSLDLVSVD
jgi:hypothetical protein